jgi:hypothetical protein
MTLARVGDESIQRFGEYEALASEGRRPLAAKSPVGKILRKELRVQLHPSP